MNKISKTLIRDGVCPNCPHASPSDEDCASCNLVKMGGS